MTTSLGATGYVVGGLLLRELEARGEVVRHEGDHVLRPVDGACFGLSSLTATCAQLPHREWREVVADHVRRILDSPVREDLMTTLTLEEAAGGVHLRLQPVEALVWPEVMTYAREVAPGLVEVLMHKSGDALVTLIDEAVDRLGYEALRELGLLNLIRSPLGAVVPHKLTGGGRVVMLRGDSGFTASRVLALPDLLRRTSGDGEEPPLPHGALVCMPDRHTLGLHVLGHPNVVAALGWLGLLGAEDFPHAAYPLSPDVHWWRDGRLIRLTDSMRPGLLLDEEFADIIKAVAGCSLGEAVARHERLRASKRRGRHGKRRG